MSDQSKSYEQVALSRRRVEEQFHGPFDIEVTGESSPDASPRTQLLTPLRARRQQWGGRVWLSPGPRADMGLWTELIWDRRAADEAARVTLLAPANQAHWEWFPKQRGTQQRSPRLRN